MPKFAASRFAPSRFAGVPSTLHLLAFGFLLITLCPLASAATFDVRSPRITDHDTTTGRKPWERLVVRSTFFREMARGAQARSCEGNLPPEPLATPDPVLDSTEQVQLTVSFVVGRDGRVYGPLVLEGTKEGVRSELARPVVEAVRLWRFRPAVCNGAPAESEAKVEFSSPHNRF